MLTIFKSGNIEYPEKLNKPVRYDADFLKNIASKTSSIKITREHSNEVLGVLENFIYEEGYLKAKKPDGFELKGYGFSPVFDCDLVDEGSYYRPVNGVMSEIGLTNNPRSNILYNSIENNNVGKGMTEALETVIKEKEELQKKIGVLENESKSFKNLLKQKDEEIAQIKKTYSDVDSKMSEIDALKEKASLYDEMQNNIRDELISDVAGDNESLKKALAEADIEVLKALKENPNINNQGNGIPPVVADGLDDGENPSDDGNESYSEEDFLNDCKAAGWE